MQQIEFIINNKRVVNYVKETNLLMLIKLMKWFYLLIYDLLVIFWGSAIINIEFELLNLIKYLMKYLSSFLPSFLPFLCLILWFASCTDDTDMLATGASENISTRDSQNIETLCDYNELALQLTQSYLDNYLINNGYIPQCHEILFEESFGSPVASFGIPEFCVLNCDIDFNEFCSEDYPDDPFDYFAAIIRQVERNFRLAACDTESFFVPTSIQASFFPSQVLCDCEWVDENGCLKLANGPTPTSSGCSSPIQLDIVGYCVVDRDYGSCVEIVNQCGGPVSVDPGDGFEENLCSLRDPFYTGNEFCIDLEEGECVTLTNPTDCNCVNPEGPIINGIDLIVLRQIELGFINNISNTNQQLSALFGDLNCDGTVDKVDNVILQRWILGLTTLGASNNCIEIGTCVLLNSNGESKVCSEDLENGPINLVQGVIGDASGTCCRGGNLFKKDNDVEELATNQVQNKIQQDGKSNIKHLSLFVTQNQYDKMDFISIEDSGIEISISSYGSVYSIEITVQESMSEHIMNIVNFMESNDNVELIKSSLIFSYVIFEDGKAYKLTRLNDQL